ncbi:MAG: large conductance mechanosensitive channel protein MscL [Eubacterium sp.]|nr:large conductance mechanosensitive channel protein MscL [Eubacterium sp.]
MKNFFNEFKKFIAQGNVMDMAVGIIIGSAFTAIVTSLVEDILTPLITMATKDLKFKELEFKGLMYGNFINAVITFILTAFVLFLIVKAMNKFKKEEPKADPTTKTCPFCKSEIDKDATKCPHCTSDL